MDWGLMVVRAATVSWHTGWGGGRLHETGLQEIRFHLLAAHVSEQLAVNLDAGRKLLPALLHHLSVVVGIVDDVAVIPQGNWYFWSTPRTPMLQPQVGFRYAIIVGVFMVLSFCSGFAG